MKSGSPEGLEKSRIKPTAPVLHLANDLATMQQFFLATMQQFFVVFFLSFTCPCNIQRCFFNKNFIGFFYLFFF